MSLVAWMVYAVVVGLLLAGAAWCLERALGRLGLPTRWVWAAALMLSVGIPVGNLLLGAGSAPGPNASGTELGILASGESPGGSVGRVAAWISFLRAPATIVEAAGILLNRAVVDGTASLPRAYSGGTGLLMFWIAASAALAATLLLGGFHLARRKARWPRVEMLGREIRISPSLGPAVVGVVRPEIVLPPWATTLEAAALDLVLSHEEAHLRARDPLLLAAGILPAVLLPWNPGLWWQLRRLRDAVEVDCDRRVLGTGVSPRRYGHLLLHLGERTQARFLPVAPFAPSRPLLLRRLRAMKTGTRPRALPLTLIPAAAGIGFLALACEAETPVVTDVLSEAPAAAGTAVPPNAEGPTFTPFEVAPEMVNRPVAQRALEREYPPLLRDAGIGGRVLVHILVSDEGEVTDALIAEASGHPAIDQAGLRVAREFRFTPAQIRGENVPVWVQIPVTFTTR